MPDPNKSGKKPKGASSNRSSRREEPSRTSSSHRVSISALLNSPRDTLSNQQLTPRTRSPNRTQEHSSHGPGEPSSSSESTAKRVAAVKCGSCSKTFDNPFQLERHMPSHTNQVLCRQCGITFPKSTYESHKRAHRQGRSAPYKCQYCSASYFDKNELRKHEQKHIQQVKHSHP